MRHIRIYTGAGGMEMFQEAMEHSVGLERVYMGKKVSRIVKKITPGMKKSLTGKYYKLVTSHKINLD